MNKLCGLMVLQYYLKMAKNKIMGENFEKAKMLLEQSVGPEKNAIIMLAMDLDTKFSELEKNNETRHQELINAVKANKKDTDEQIACLESRVSKMKVVQFFSENPKYLYLTIAGLIALLIFAGIGDLIKLIK